MSGAPLDSPGAPQPLFTPRATGPRRRPGPLALIGSVLLHLFVLLPLAFGDMGGPPRPPEYKVYRVNLYSPPPQALGEPEPAPPAPRAAITPPRPKPVVAPKATPKKATPKAVTAPAKAAPKVTKGPNPKPGAAIGGENIDINLAGDEFPDPVYLENVITQINRYFRWSGAGNLETHIGFYILRDGSVTNVRVLRRSGNISFDLAAVAAIENAGKRGGYGPLPKVWPRDTLPVMFKFEPPK